MSDDMANIIFPSGNRTSLIVLRRSQAARTLGRALIRTEKSAPVRDKVGHRVKRGNLGTARKGLPLQLILLTFTALSCHIDKFTTDLIAKRGFRARERRERSGTVGAC